MFLLKMLFDIETQLVERVQRWRSPGEYIELYSQFSVNQTLGILEKMKQETKQCFLKVLRFLVKNQILKDWISAKNKEKIRTHIFSI